MHLNFPPFPYIIPVVPFFSSLGAVLVDQYCNPLADVTLDSISAQLDEITEKVKKMLRIKNPSHPSLRIAQGQLLSLTELEKNICFIFFSFLFLSFFPFIMFLQRFIISWCLKPEGLGFPFLVHSKKVNMSKSVWQRWHSCTKSITFTLMQSLVVLFLVCIAGNCSVVEDFELQRQVICALNSVLYEQLQYKGNECDYYNPLNSYIHQVDFPENPVSSRCQAFEFSNYSSLWNIFTYLLGNCAGATTSYRHSHKPLRSLHDIGPEAGCSAGTRQLSQSLPAALVPETDRVQLSFKKKNSDPVTDWNLSCHARSLWKGKHGGEE